jgi:Fic family protein
MDKTLENIQELYKQWRELQPLKSELQHRIDQQFMFDFNYNSNHLEGNTLTYGQTKLLLLFGRVEGEGLMRDFEEMKAHNVGLELMKREAVDKNRPLSESFIRELNHIILAGDFYKLSNDRQYRYKIHTGVYKTRPNSVITPSGEMFDYALPEETPSMMGDLVHWYNDEEKKAILTPIELAALFHYCYIRIHPFEDGNGRIARLFVNYMLLRHGYPMIVIPTADRNTYLETLWKCDKNTGISPSNGAHANIRQILPFIDYIQHLVEKKLTLSVQFAKGAITSFSENIVCDNDPKSIMDNHEYNKQTQQNDPNHDPNNTIEKRRKVILQIIKMNNKVSRNEIAKILKTSDATIKRDLQYLKENGIIERIDGNRGGHWIIKKLSEL